MIGQRTRTRPWKDGTRFSSGFYLDVESYIAERSLTDMHAFQQWDDFLLGLSRLKHYFHYESYIDKPRPWWHWVRNGGTHFFAGHLDTQTESRVHPDRKRESSSRRQLISAPTLITPAKKTETVRGFVGLNISCLIIRRHLTFIIKLIPH